MADRLIFTCEHGGCLVPPEYSHLFRGQTKVLKSHRGYDPGSLELAERCAARFEAPLISCTTTRLFVELNRSLGHPRLFSESMASVDLAERQRLLDQYYHPYRKKVEKLVADTIARGHRAVHISVHSFTPVLDGQVRRGDVGLLYDPRRAGERAFCHRWQQTLLQRRPDLTVRRNYPYLGRSDGFTTHLRRYFAPTDYLGIELEVNQSWPTGSRAAWGQLQLSLVDSLADARKSDHDGRNSPTTAKRAN